MGVKSKDTSSDNTALIPQTQPMTFGYRLAAATGIHKGDRAYQQDQVALITHPVAHGCVLGVLADGMGGRSGGRKAADQVMLTARQLFERYSPETDDADELLRRIGMESHMVIKLIAVASEQEPHSTFAAFLVNAGGDCHFAHSGDSRLYHFRSGLLMHRTTDHSYVQMLLDRGEITDEEAEVHPQSNILLGCLGTENEPPIESHRTGRLIPGDVVICCSDGVWHYHRPEEIGEICRRLQPRDAIASLIETARNRGRGSGDNLSVVLMRIEAISDAPEPDTAVTR